MSNICSCDSTSANFGRPDCLTRVGKVTGMLFVPSVDASGYVHAIASGDTLDQAYIDAKLKATVSANRWYLIDGLEEVTLTVGDTEYKEYSSGAKRRIRKGITTISAVIPDGFAPQMLAKIEANSCQTWRVYFITENNNVIGECSGTDLLGRKVANGTFDGTPVYETDSESGELVMTFDIERASREDLVDYVSFDADLQSLETLIDVYAVNATSTVAVATFTLETSFGAKNSRTKAKGLTATEVEVYNVTDSSAVTASGITEVDGVYTYTYSVAQDASDVVRVQGVGGVNVQLCFDLTQASNTSITI